jgi:hypothetical protein
MVETRALSHLPTLVPGYIFSTLIDFATIAMVVRSDSQFISRRRGPMVATMAERSASADPYSLRIKCGEWLVLCGDKWV